MWSRIVCQIHAVSPESGRDSFSSLSLKAISDSVPSCLLFNHTLHSLSSAAVKLLIESPVWLQMTHFCLLFFRIKYSPVSSCWGSLAFVYCMRLFVKKKKKNRINNLRSGWNSSYLSSFDPTSPQLSSALKTGNLKVNFRHFQKRSVVVCIDTFDTFLISQRSLKIHIVCRLLSGFERRAEWHKTLTVEKPYERK